MTQTTKGAKIAKKTFVRFMFFGLKNYDGSSCSLVKI